MSGYIGNIPVPQATQTRDVFTATSGQTSFATSGYTPGFLDVWLNGVKLVNGTDFTATNGSDVVLSSGAATSDIVEVLSYSTYEVNAQTYTGGLTAKNDGAAAITANRLNSDGAVVNIQESNTTTGVIGSNADRPFIAAALSATDAGIKFTDAQVLPVNRAGSNVDNAIDFGNATSRFKNLYLSGGVYLGGTGAANLLDDYEEGTFTASWQGSSTAGTPAGTFSGAYRKVGNLVYCSIRISAATLTGAAGILRITGLPFVASTAGSGGTAYLEGVTPVYTTSTPQTGSHVQIYANGNTTVGDFRVGISSTWDNYLSSTSTFTGGSGGSTYGLVSLTYMT